MKKRKLNSKNPKYMGKNQVSGPEIKEKVLELKKCIKASKSEYIINSVPYVISAVSHVGIKELVLKTYNAISKISDTSEEKEKEEYKVFTIDDVEKEGFEVKKEGKVYQI